MKPRTKLVLTSPVLRWAGLAVAIAIAVTVALWPRDGSSPDTAAARPSTPSHGAADLAAARAAANLPPCTNPSGGPSDKATASGPLAGLRVTCLGDGSTVTLGRVLDGKPTLINVWATWCAPCKHELPVLGSYRRGAGAINVVEVLVKSNPADGLDMLHQLGVRLPTLYDGGGTLAAALRLPNGLPASYLVGPDGIPHLIGSPRVFRSPDAVRQAVAASGDRHESG